MTIAETDRNPLVEFARRRWLVCAAAILIAALAAGLYAVRAGRLTWTCAGTMLYNRTMLGAPHYQQPEVQSILGLFRARDVLETLARELNRSENLKPLADSATAEIVAGSNTIQLTMRGGDLRETQTSLDRLMQLVVNRAGTLRRSAVEQILIGLDKNLADVRRAADQAYADLNQFQLTHQIVTSVDDDLERLQDDVAELTRASEVDRPSTLDPDELLQRRRGALQDRIERERETIALESQLAIKKNEYERAQQLHSKRYISDAEFRRIETEYRTLAAQNDAALQSWNRQISELDQTLSNRLAPPSTGSNANAETRPETLAATTRMQAFLAQRRLEIERLVGLRAESSRLQQAVTASQDEVRRIAALKTSFAELYDSPYHDLTIIQAAAPALDPIASNTKKLFIGSWFAALSLLIVPLYLWDFFTAGRSHARPTAGGALAKLPTIAFAETGIGDSNAGRTEAIRTLALRLQQAASQNGIVASINALTDGDTPLDVVVETAECLHRRGELVLIVDLIGDAATTRQLIDSTGTESIPTDVVGEWTTPGISFDAQPRTRTITTSLTDAGLAELLTKTDVSVAEVIRHGERYDVLTVGSGELPEEAFAGRRLTTVLDECRRNYSVVLLHGPSLDRGVDLELLSARVNALVFVAKEGVVPSAAAERTLTNLVRLKAPLLGVVSL